MIIDFVLEPNNTTLGEVTVSSTLRHARRYEGHFRNLDALCPIEVKGCAPKLCNAILRSPRIPFSLANFLYLTLRRLYSSTL